MTASSRFSMKDDWVCGDRVGPGVSKRVDVRLGWDRKNAGFPPLPRGWVACGANVRQRVRGSLSEGGKSRFSASIPAVGGLSSTWILRLTDSGMATTSRNTAATWWRPFSRHGRTLPPSWTKPLVIDPVDSNSRSNCLSHQNGMRHWPPRPGPKSGPACPAERSRS